MATFDAAVSGPDAAPDLRLATHQYNQLLHPSSPSTRPPPRAACSPACWRPGRPRPRPPSPRSPASSLQTPRAPTKPSGSSPPCGRSTASRRASGPTAPCLPRSGAPGRLARPTLSRPTWWPPLHRRKSPRSPFPCGQREGQGRRQGV
ncbi:hypothetical protein ACQJBY_048684 [Aegilops geniculata]